MTAGVQVLVPDALRLATGVGGQATTTLGPVVIGFGVSLLTLGSGEVVGLTKMKKKKSRSIFSLWWIESHPRKKE